MATTRLTSSVDLHEALIEHLEELKIAGAAIAVSKGNDYIRGYAGAADVRTAGLVNADTQFEIGSITKVFTATLMVLLSEKGLVDLEAPVTQYLPDLKIDQKSPPTSLTVRTLLDYTAGMEGDFFQDFGEGDDCTRKYTEACRSLKYIHEPGEMRAYNSTAYCLAGRLIEVVTDLTFDQALSTFFLVPAGFKSFSFRRPRNAAFDYAIGHRWNPATSKFDSVGDERLPRAMTASGARLSMPVHELHRFGQFHLFGGLSPSGTQIVSSEMIEKMRTPFGTLPPHDSERLLGWAAINFEGHRFTIATGETVDQNSLLIFSPEHEFVLAIMTNGSGAALPLFEKIGLCLIKEMTGVDAKIPKPDLREAPGDIAADLVVGNYTNGTTYSIQKKNEALILEARENHKQLSDPPDQLMKLVPLGGARFGLVPEGSPSPVAAIEFLFASPDASHPSHISQAGRLFSRLP